jgi:acetyl-CoA carboxylase biotin carboxyl carrier protein
LNPRKTKSKAKPDAGGGGEDRGDAGPMSVGFLQQLVSLMAANDLHVVELREGERRIKLQRGASAAAQHFMMPSVGQAAQAPASVPAVTSAGGSGGAAAASKDEDANLIAIKSPMVGTFYTASSPDAKPFVSVGSVVDEETDVCIIEAMKVFNNIKAECRGTIAKVMVTNGQTVEFGTVLFLVKPA